MFSSGMEKTDPYVTKLNNAGKITPPPALLIIVNKAKRVIFTPFYLFSVK